MDNKNKNLYSLNSYDYDLPQECIAQFPYVNRDNAKLMILNENNIFNNITLFSDVISFLPKESLIIANNTKVFPSRLIGFKESGGKIEFLLTTPFNLLSPEKKGDDSYSAYANGLLSTSKGISTGSILSFGENLSIKIIERGEGGLFSVKLMWKGDLENQFEKIGHVPLPPYIRRTDTASDRSDYQTVYAHPEQTGSIAAPTAGLHFTKELINRLQISGFEWLELTLHVGIGTFKPVKCDDIRKHVMHQEYVIMKKEAANRIKNALLGGKPIIAIGTTTVRALEAIKKINNFNNGFEGYVNIYIYPGYQFEVINGMITNFHLPKSTLMMMVCAFGGYERVMQAYNQAIKENFNFFSYGDAMLILK